MLILITVLLLLIIISSVQSNQAKGHITSEGDNGTQHMGWGKDGANPVRMERGWDRNNGDGWNGGKFLSPCTQLSNTRIQKIEDMDISMDIHIKSVDMAMDAKFHIHGKHAINIHTYY